MLKMKLCWSLVLCILQISSISAFGFLKGMTEDKPGLLDILTKPKVPKIPFLPAVGIQIGTQVGEGSFGFGFGFGISKPEGGVNLPPKEKPHPEKDEVGPRPDWDDKDEKVGPRPDWDDKDEKVGPRPNWEEKDKKPQSEHPVKEDSKPEPYEDKNDANPDWESIGETDHEESEDFMDRDLVGDGVILPRVDRVKRRVNSKVFHVPLKFISNARPFKVQFHSHPNSLTKDNYV